MHLLFLQNKYFMDQSVHALQYLDILQMKDPNHKANFYHNLKKVLPFIPKVTVASVSRDRFSLRISRDRAAARCSKCRQVRFANLLGRTDLWGARVAWRKLIKLAFISKCLHSDR